MPAKPKRAYEAEQEARWAAMIGKVTVSEDGFIVLIATHPQWLLTQSP
jgi:hypothetical protein